MVHQAFAEHSHVTWLSKWCLKYPNRPELNRLAMRIIDLPLPERYIQKIIYPGEYYPFWEYHCSGFSEPCRDLGKEDVMNTTKITARKVFSDMLSPKRPRLLIKITGWPRVGFLREIFPDAKFIHIYRDGRAVVNSWLHVKWWSGWGGPEHWRWGPLTPEQQQKWASYGKSFVVLAAIGWEILMSSYDKVKQTLPPSHFLELRYEDLCQDRTRFFRMAAEFGGLEWSPGFEAAVDRSPLESANNKWKKDLSGVQQNMLCEALRDSLYRYGYS
jgi:omega-hydroxy-beta-dihydromenaquinone-9 sulfotransferase